MSAGRALPILFALGLVSGAVFALQGFALLPSQLMYGKPEWIVIGSIMVVVSLAGLWWTRIRPRA